MRFTKASGGYLLTRSKKKRGNALDLFKQRMLLVGKYLLLIIFALLIVYLGVFISDAVGTFAVSFFTAEQLENTGFAIYLGLMMLVIFVFALVILYMILIGAHWLFIEPFKKQKEDDHVHHNDSV